MRRNRLIKFCLVMILILISTGCVKYNASIEIKKNKSMDFNMIYAVDTSVFGTDKDILESDDIKKLKEQGYSVKEYKDGNMKGFELGINVPNIDKVSSSDAKEYDLSGILNNTNKDTKIFKLKKGWFKNKYTADFKFNSSESGLSDKIDASTDSSDETSSSWTDDDSSLYDDSSVDGMSHEDTNYSVKKLTDSDDDSDWSNMFSQGMGSLDLSFNVKLPYSAISNNATSTNNDNKELTWKLTSDKVNSIKFEFSLYNSINIIITIVGGILLIGGVVVFVLKKKKNSTDKSTFNNGEVAPVDNNVVNPINNGEVAPLDNNVVTSVNNGEVTPVDNNVVTSNNDVNNNV